MLLRMCRSQWLGYTVAVGLAGLGGQAFAPSSATAATVVLHDDFPGTSLDPAWQKLPFGPVSGVTEEVASSNYHVSDVRSSNPSGGRVGRVLERPVNPVSDFHAEFTFSYTDGGAADATQDVAVYLYGSSSQVAGGGVQDGGGTSGAVIAAAGPTQYTSGAGSAPHQALFRFTIDRVGSNVAVARSIDGGSYVTVASGTSSDPVNRVDIQVTHDPVGGSAVRRRLRRPRPRRGHGGARARRRAAGARRPWNRGRTPPAPSPVTGRPPTVVRRSWVPIDRRPVRTRPGRSTRARPV